MPLSAGDRHLSYGYSGFSQVRDGIAAAIGIKNREKHYAGQFTNYSLLGFWVNPEEENHLDEPVLEPEDDIDYLMLHQDCEGILMPWTSKRIARRMKDIMARIPDDSVWPSFSTRTRAIELLDLLEYAGENGIIVEFA